MKFKIFLLFFFFSFKGFSARVPLQYNNSVYEEAIKTVQIRLENSNEVIPVVGLGIPNQLILEFDELTTTNDYYQYDIIHCTSNWQKSNIDPNQYLEGNRFENIDNYANSTNTYIKYVHYTLPFPSPNMMPKISGNYLLVVYRNFDKEDIILSRRFYVIENKVIISAKANSATSPELRFTSQEIDFEVDASKIQIQNPMEDCKVVISQNFLEEFTIYNLKPRFIVGNVLNYNYEKENVFGGGKEFRFFDSRSLRFLTLNVEKKTLTNEGYFLNLITEEPRYSTSYQMIKDADGKMIILNKDGVNAATDGDYTITKFNLKYPIPLSTDDIYIYGELSNWKIDENFKMHYDNESKCYTTTVVLKQGYYNYNYVSVPISDQKMQPEYTLTEGNNMETQNTYYMFFYSRNLFLDYDELIGYDRILSNEQ